MSEVRIAKIVKPQGIKGEVKARPLTNVLAVFNDLENVSIEGKMYEIEHISFRQGFLYVKFKGVASRNDAENLRNKSFSILREQLESSKEEDELIVDDIIGMVLYDNQGEMVGQIMDVENYGATDILIIESEKRQYQVPYIKSIFTVKNGQIVVDRKEYEGAKV